MNETKQSILVCPKCFAMANPAFVTDESEILWWFCPGCNVQGVYADFMDLTIKTGRTGHNNKGK